jgi:hypothetical protein
METLPAPEESGGSPGRLSPWQETHARLMLERVPQLRDLRFVLCPRQLDEYDFWRIYFALCRRYLPKNALGAPGAGLSSSDDAGAAGGGGGAASAAGARGSPVRAAAAPAAAAAAPRGASAAAAAAAGAAAATGAAAAAAAGGSGSEEEDYQEAAAGASDSLADLAADPELDAYLQARGRGALGCARACVWVWVWVWVRVCSVCV